MVEAPSISKLHDLVNMDGMVVFMKKKNASLMIMSIGSHINLKFEPSNLNDTNAKKGFTVA